MKKISKTILAVAVVAGLLAAGAARADDWNDHERHAEDWHKHHHHHHHGHAYGHDHDEPVIVQEPNVVYVPPVVVEPPPPPPEDNSGLSIVIPINIR
jgi:Ni/Co efflux regulator RcnB